MNIVYYTNITGKKSAGLTYSIPAQVKAQSKLNNVYWFNTTDKSLGLWEETGVFNNISSVKSYHIKDFPNPFNKPDLIVFQSFYFIKDCIIARYLKKHKIPYIIIPRGALTHDAQNMKKVKKWLGNLIFFKKFAKKAVAINYLTNQEFKDSGNKWNSKSIIIPNGTFKKNNVKEWDSKKSKKGIFIGRLDIYHKGLDLLISACKNNLDLMKEHNCTIDIYGPKNSDYSKIQKLIKEKGLDKILALKGPIYDKDKESVLLSSDFFVLTSRFEGHPMGLIEALSYGLPCLVTSGSNMAEEISSANAGWTAKINEKSLSIALKELIYNKKDLEKKGNNALKLSENYNWDKLAKLSCKEYKELV